MLKTICLIFLLSLSGATALAQYFEVIKQQYADFDEKPSRYKSAPFYMDLYRTDRAAYWDRKLYYNDTIEGIIASIGKCKDSLGQMKEGAFVYYFKNGATKSEGSYLNNLKEGEWKEWNETGVLSNINHYRNGKMVGRNIRWYDNKTISDSTILDENGNGQSFSFNDSGVKLAEGIYTSGNKNGRWTYYYSNVKNQKSIEVNYEMDSVKSYTCFTESGQLQKKDCVFEREANFRGGEEQWRRYLVRKLTAQSNIYSKYLKSREVYMVIVKFVVAKDGSITDAKVENKRNAILDNMALEIIQDSTNWIPAIQYNHKVNAYRRQPITFIGLE